VKLASALFLCLLCTACATISGPTELNPAPPAAAARQKPEPPSGPASAAAGGRIAQELPRATPFSRQELVALAVEQRRAGLLPVRRDGTPMSVVADLNGDGLPDVALLEVAAENPAGADYSVLSRLSRLFTEDSNTPAFTLAIYFQSGGALRFDAAVPLGRKPVLEGLRLLGIRGDGTAPPDAVIASFQGHDGEEQEWTIFSDGGSYSRLSLISTPTIRSVVRDVDGDGVLDVLVFHTGVEAGLGYETLITWYRFSNGAYREYRTTNIVRNLKDFLASSRRLLSDSNWKGFLAQAVAPATLEALHGRYHSTEAIVAALFHSLVNTQSGSAGPAFDYFTPARAIQNVVFPDILENPFPDPNRSSSFTMTVRVVCCNGESRFYSATVSILPNPFGSREFSFITD